MKTNAKFKMIACIAAVILIVVGIFVPRNICMPMEIIGFSILFVLAILKWIVPSQKNTILKIVGLIVLYLGALSWAIPVQNMYAETPEMVLERMSLFNLVDYPYLSIQYFLQPALLIILIGGFYGILSETGKLRNALDKIVKKLKGKETYFLIGASAILVLLSSLFAAKVDIRTGIMFGPNLVLFILIPIVCGIVLLMGYDKMTAFLTGFISPLIGIIGGIYSPTTTYINEVLGSDHGTVLIWKIALLTISYTLYIFILLKQAKKSKERKKDTTKEEENKEEIPLIGEKKQNKKSTWPMYLILGLLVLVMILGMFNWEGIFNVKLFGDIHKSITEFEIADFKPFSYLIDGLTAFGTWTSLAEISVMVLSASLILCLIYRIKFDEAIDAFVKGVKQVIKPVVVMTLAYTVVIVTAYNPILISITEWLTETLGGGIIKALGNVSFLSGAMEAISQIIFILISGIDTIISTIVNIDILYVVQSGLPYLLKAYPESTNALAIITQSLYGLTLLIAPTSTLMIIGLEYLGISYKEWLKTCGKLVLQLLAIILVIILIVVFI